MKIRLSVQSKLWKQSISLKTLILFSISILSFNPSFAQSEKMVTSQYESILKALDSQDWKAVDSKCGKLLKSIDAQEYADLVSIVSYMHLRAISGRMNNGELNKKEALNKAEVYKGKSLILPGHPFKSKCRFNCLYPTEDDPKILFCTSSNDEATLIYAFEYFEMEDDMSDSFLNENEGKIMKIRARLKEIDVEGNILPRFKMRFDQVEYYFLDDETKDNNKLTEISFHDSLNTYLQHDVFVNSSGTIFKKYFEFEDKNGSKVQASFYRDTDLIKKKLVLKSVLRKDSFDFSSIEFPDEAMLREGEIGDESPDLKVIKPMQIIQHNDFKGYVVGYKSKNDDTKNTTFNVLLYREGRLCNIMYFIADILGNDIDTEQEQKHFFDFIKKIEIKTNDQIKVLSPIK